MSRNHRAADDIDFVGGATARSCLGFERSLAKTRNIRHVPVTPAKIGIIRPKSGKATLAGIPFLADLVFNRQTGPDVVGLWAACFSSGGFGL
jgi:hypothetical protein